LQVVVASDDASETASIADPGYKFVPLRKKPLHPPKSPAEKKKEEEEREERKKKRIEKLQAKHPSIAVEREAPLREAYRIARENIERQSLSQRQQAMREAAQAASEHGKGKGKKKRRKILKGTKRVF